MSLPENEPLNIAIISNEPTPYRLSVLRRLASELEGVRVHNIFTHRSETAQAPWEMRIDPNLNLVFFEEYALAGHELDPIRMWRLFKKIRSSLEERKVRLAILLGYNDFTRFALIRWANRVGLPLLLTGDSNVFTEGRLPAWKRIIKRWYVRWVVSHVAGLMPMGTCGRAFFRLYADHDKPTFLFPYEPDYASLTSCDKEELQRFLSDHRMRENRPRLIFCGRLVRVKRVDLLIDAFKRIAVQRPDWDLMIVGDGPLRGLLEERVPPEVRHRVYFLGFLQFGQARLAYHSADVLVLPSDYEPWGVVINEAAACGLAIIATEVVGAAAELVNDGVNGLIVPPGNVAAMTAALLEATEGVRCHQMQAEATRVLNAWRRQADPVNGVRVALAHYGLSRSDCAKCV